MGKQTFVFYAKRNFRLPRFFLIIVFVLLVVGCYYAAFAGAKNDFEPLPNISIPLLISSNGNYIAEAIGGASVLFLLSIWLRSAFIAIPSIEISESGLSLDNQVHVPWHAIKAVHEYRNSYVEYDETWVLIETTYPVRGTTLHVKSDTAVLYKNFIRTHAGHIEADKLLPINCRRTGIDAEELLSCIGGYFYNVVRAGITHSA